MNLQDSSAGHLMTEEIANLPKNATSEPVVESQIPSPKLPNSCGAMLCSARESREWSVQYVADQLKLSVRQIVWLEANEFQHLPTPVVVRGFVRSYAKLLKIDAEPLITLLPVDSAVVPDISGFKPTLTTPFQQSRLPMLGHQDGTNGRYIGGAVVFTVLAVGFFALQRFEHTGALDNFMRGFSVSSPASEAETVSIASEVASVSEAMNSTVAMHESLALTASESSASLPVVAEASSAASAAIAKMDSATSSPQASMSVATSIAASNPTASSVSASNGGALRLKFRQDSWIQVKRENGEVLNSHLAKAGTEEVLELKEPLQIRIGNVAGVDAVLRGTPFVISGAQGSNVANIVVK
jgi:cytoskeleton protein RodZ